MSSSSNIKFRKAVENYVSPVSCLWRGGGRGVRKGVGGRGGGGKARKLETKTCFENSSVRVD